MNIYYVYIYHNEEGLPYYIGKGVKNRVTEHINAARKGKKYPLADKIRSLWKNNKEPLFQKVASNLSEKAAYDLEEFLIGQYRRRIDGGLLLNLSTGGAIPSKGAPAANKGIPCSEEMKVNISNKLKVYYSTRSGPRKGAEGLSLWQNPKSNHAAWSNLDLFYRYFLLGLKHKTLHKVFPDISPTIFATVTAYFEANGNPELDSAWLDYKKTIGSYEINEKPYALKRSFHFTEGLENAEDIHKLVLQGKWVKSISKQLKIPYGAVATIARDIRNGWMPLEDTQYLFAKTRAQAIASKNKQKEHNDTRS